jgi:hypothetical protein
MGPNTRVSYIMICLMARDLQPLIMEMSTRETIKMARRTDQESTLGLPGANMMAAGIMIRGLE